MNILISNDDGINSNGIRVLAKHLAKKHNVLVVAPSDNRSAFSHSLTLKNKLELNECFDIEGCKAYSLSGTPVDCVKFSELVFTDFKPDIVLSGINKGHNLGCDILYSGTVSIAYEASIYGHVAIAFSAFSHGESNFELFAEYAEKIMESLLKVSSGGDIWNVNFPDSTEFSKIKGIKVTQLGKQLYADRYEKVSFNEYQLVGYPLGHEKNPEDCDLRWIEKGYITITPLLYNRTDYDKIEKIRNKCEIL